ncbi:MAG TPA: lamin tail domain-containing protein, partial [Pyrinomonadaceae bacterium]|nr:lamin tail domain-containing protein [Pyrinomonadaceae bacterium]
FFFTSANSTSPASSVLLAITQGNNPTGTWDRYVFDADPTATSGPGGSGKWADYPTIGFNQNWIVANYNVFNYACNGAGVCATTGYAGPYIYVIGKTDAYDGGTLTDVDLFTDTVANCVSPFNNILGCGFTMAPSVDEDNTTGPLYLVEDWDSVFGQLRVSKLTLVGGVPVLTVGTQFPQSTENWRFNAARIGTGGVAGASGGYVPQRAQDLFVTSGTRVMANDSRINNSVLRNGSLWASHHAMVGLTPTAPGTAFGTLNPDVRTAVQWWEIDPTVEAQPDPITGLGTAPTQRGRIVDPLADNCNSGNSINASTERTAGSAIPCAGQQGQFFFFAGISVNKDNDVLVGFTQSSPRTFPSAAYALRRASDPANTMRDVVVFTPGKSNYNIGAGAGANRQNRWGDYSASMVDPVNDTDFWTVQEYSETRTALAGLGGAIAAPWATWWSVIKPTSTQPSTAGNLIISEFRVRGPQGVSDEFVELYNPSTTTPLRVASNDNSEGWTLAVNNGATTTALTAIPQGTVIAPRGRLLITHSPVSTAAGAESLYYSLNGYAAVTAPGTPPGVVRTADADTGFSATTAATDVVPDNSGVALFKSTVPAAFILANQADAAGFAGAGTTFREGTGIPAITPGAVTGQISFHRNQSSGAPQDTNDNAADFIFTNTNHAETLGSTPRLGAPGPENLDGPRTNFNVFVDRFDQSTGINNAPNRFRDLTPVTNGSLGTLAFRRRVTNLTGQTVTRLRFRIRQITTAPAPPGTADLRALTSGDIIVSGLPVKGTSVEEPPTQALGGGWNTTWNVDLASPLAPGGFIDVQYVVGVNQSGGFSIFINVE